MINDDDLRKYAGNKIKQFREQKNITQDELAEELGTTRQAVSRYENGDRGVNQFLLFQLAKYFNKSIDDFFPPVHFDNGTYMKPIIDDDNMVQIPVLGTIKAGIAIEAQQDILEYIEIPKTWIRGGKQFYGLKISGDSMFPKYQENDIVVFEDSHEYDMESARNKDCAVMVNGDDATFKKVLLSDDGITLVPYNTGAYDIKMYSKEDIVNKPIRIIGVAREKRTRVWGVYKNEKLVWSI